MSTSQEMSTILRLLMGVTETRTVALRNNYVQMEAQQLHREVQLASQAQVFLAESGAHEELQAHAELFPGVQMQAQRQQPWQPWQQLVQQPLHQPLHGHLQQQPAQESPRQRPPQPPPRPDVRYDQQPKTSQFVQAQQLQRELQQALQAQMSLAESRAHAEMQAHAQLSVGMQPQLHTQQPWQRPLKQAFAAPGASRGGSAAAAAASAAAGAGHWLQPAATRLSSDPGWAEDIGEDAVQEHVTETEGSESTGYSTAPNTNSYDTLATICSDSSIPKAPLSRDAFTTLMVRNVAARYTKRMLLKDFDCATSIDFLYLPGSCAAKMNHSFVFINFMFHEQAVDFMAKWQKKRLPSYGAQKPLNICPASVQGLEANLKTVANKRRMAGCDGDDCFCTPMLREARVVL